MVLEVDQRKSAGLITCYKKHEDLLIYLVRGLDRAREWSCDQVARDHVLTPVSSVPTGLPITSPFPIRARPPVIAQCGSRISGR